MRALLARRSHGALVVSSSIVPTIVETIVAWTVTTIVAWTVASPASAMTVLPLDLPALTSEAGRIFVGRVEDVRSGRDAKGIPSVWTTFTVAESLKGQAEARVTIKQLGTSFGTDARVAPHAGLPRYRPGESVLLFVHAESGLGFTSPVGLGQGCFRIREHAGHEVVENDVGNRNLAAGAGAAGARARTTASAGAPAELPLATLLDRVRTLVAPTP